MVNLSIFLGKPLWQMVIEQFEDLLVRILLLAAIISFVSPFFIKFILHFIAYYANLSCIIGFLKVFVELVDYFNLNLN